MWQSPGFILGFFWTNFKLIWYTDYKMLYIVMSFFLSTLLEICKKIIKKLTNIIQNYITLY